MSQKVQNCVASQLKTTTEVLPKILINYQQCDKLRFNSQYVFLLWQNNVGGQLSKNHCHTASLHLAPMIIRDVLVFVRGALSYFYLRIFSVFCGKNCQLSDKLKYSPLVLKYFCQITRQLCYKMYLELSVQKQYYQLYPVSTFKCFSLFLCH